MTTIKKILDQEGNQILPVTSTNAVISPDGTSTIESRMQYVEDNRKDAYEIAVTNGFHGTEQEWLNSLKATVGEFKFAEYDSNAPSTIGDTATTISGITASSDTMSKMLLMPNAASSPTATRMYVTNKSGSSYVFVYNGDLNLATNFGSGQAINEVSLVNDCTTGGSNDVLSAEQGKVLLNFIGGEFDANFTVEQGYIDNTTGINTGSNTRIRTVGKVHATKLYYDSGIGKIRIFAYSGTDFITVYPSDRFLTGTGYVSITGATDYRVVFAFSDDSSITPADFSTLHASVKIVIDSDIQDKLKQLEIDKVDKSLINLIDWDNISVVENSYYKGSTGQIASGTGDRTYMRMPLIPVKGNTQYCLSCIRNEIVSGLGRSEEIAICFYYGDNVTTFISSVSGNSLTFLTPNNAKYMGVSLYNYDNITKPCFQEGSVRNYYPYSLIAGYIKDLPDESITSNMLSNNSVTEDKVGNKAITPEKANFFVLSKNLFDYKTMLIEGYYITSYGGVSSNSNYCCSDFIPIDPTNSDIVSTMHGSGGSSNAFYDENKAYITDSSFKAATSPIPQNAKYVRWTFPSTNIETLKTIQVEYGAESTPFVSYGYKIDEQYIPQSEDAVSNEIIVPKYLYLLSGVNNDVFYEPILKKWNPYRYDIFANTVPNSRDYVKAIKRVVTLNNPTATSLSLSLYDLEKEDFIQTKSMTFRKGTQGVGNSEIKVGIIGDSYTDGGCFTSALLANGYVPNIKLVGTRSVDSTAYINQRTDGRSGWTLATFSTPQTGADYFNPFVHPQGNHRFWGNTAFWANVCGGSPSGYGTRYTHYSSLCDGNGYPIAPIEGDVIYDSINTSFKEYQSGSWVTVLQTDYTWEFNYAKYLAMWDIETPDILCIMLGVNDFWVNHYPSDENLATWKTQMDGIISSYLSVNPNGKFVVLTANTVTHSNVLHYRPLDVHNRMQILRKFVISEYDNRESEKIYVVDTAQLIDSENAFTLVEANPFDGYPNGYGYSNKEVYAGDGQHPRVGYTTLGYSLAAFIQYFR